MLTHKEVEKIIENSRIVKMDNLCYEAHIDYSNVFLLEIEVVIHEDLRQNKFSNERVKMYSKKKEELVKVYQADHSLAINIQKAIEDRLEKQKEYAVQTEVDRIRKYVSQLR